jgi:TonB family protein
MNWRAAIVVAALATFLCAGIALRAQDSQPPASSSEKPAAPAVAPDPNAHPKRLRVGGNVAKSRITRMVQPAYPQIAKTAHIEGTLVLHAVIAKDGTIQELQYVSGPQLLMKASMDAVRQWQYQPMLLNGEPVEVDTTISVVFTLEGSAPANPQPEHTADIDPELRADILQMLELSHFKEKSQEMMTQISQSVRANLIQTLPNTPNREKIVDLFFERLGQLITSPDGIDGLVRIYAKYFTDEDVKAALKFYATPAGQHFLEIYPKVYIDSVQWGQRLGQEGAPKILKQLCVEYPELQVDRSTCPADPEKSSELRQPDSPAGRGK